VKQAILRTRPSAVLETDRVTHSLRRVPSLLLLLLLLALWLTLSARPRDSPPANSVLWAEEVARLAVHLESLPSDFEKTTFLRRYVGELLDIGSLDGQTQRRYRAVSFASFDPAEYYPLFRRNSLPANCGITSFFYIKLLHTFGFKAYQYSFGFTDEPYQRFIHSVALVEIGGKGTRRLIIQDPYLNLTYRSQGGEPMDFYEFLSAIKARRYDNVVMDAAALTTSLLVPDVELYYPHLSSDCQTGMAAAITRPDGSKRTELSITRSYATLMKSACADFEKGFTQALRDHGLDEPFVYAYTLRASDLVGSPDHHHVQREIDAVLR
jgi:hypothetical protein